MFISAKALQQPESAMVTLLCRGTKRAVLCCAKARVAIEGLCKGGPVQSPVPAVAVSSDSGFWQCVADPFIRRLRTMGVTVKRSSLRSAPR